MSSASTVINQASAASLVLPTPETDLAAFTDQLGQAWGVGAGEPIVQYVVWAETAGIFPVIAEHGSVSLDDLRRETPLNDSGIDALLGVLRCLKLVVRQGDERLTLSALAQEYFLKSSPYCILPGLRFRRDDTIPTVFLRGRQTGPMYAGQAFDESRARARLHVQHSRNFAPSVVAARSGSFDGITHVIDIGGGSGVFAIPLALDRKNIRVTLVDLPVCLAGTRELLASYGLENRITLVGMDMLAGRWDLPECDGVLFGNIFHCFDDQRCGELCDRAFNLLPPGGVLWLHEVLFDESREGPMIAALWNANMRTIGGRQRTASELFRMVEKAGFEDCSVQPTAGRFSLIACRRPA